VLALLEAGGDVKANGARNRKAGLSESALVTSIRGPI